MHTAPSGCKHAACQLAQGTGNRWMWPAVNCCHWTGRGGMCYAPVACSLSITELVNVGAPCSCAWRCTRCMALPSASQKELCTTADLCNTRAHMPMIRLLGTCHTEGCAICAAEGRQVATCCCQRELNWCHSQRYQPWQTAPGLMSMQTNQTQSSPAHKATAGHCPHM